MSSLPTFDRVRQVLDYDAESGIVRWKCKTHPRASMTPGAVAGCRNAGGYIVVSFDGALHYVHRLVWLWVTGRAPCGLIDHRDGCPSNNAWANLRDGSHALNQQNQRRAPRHSISRVLGASVHRKKFVSRISGQYLGSFDTADAAHAVYVEAKRRMHAGCTI